MIEVFLIALLLWLWVIERRLNSLNDTVRSLRLDVDGLRSVRSAAPAKPQDELPGLPEVTALTGSQASEAVKKAAVH